VKLSLSKSAVVGVFAVLGFSNCLAETDLDDRFSISLGAFITDRDTDTQLNSATLGSGTIIDLESDLGLDNSDSVFRIDGHYRFGRKHRATFSVFDLSRDAVKAIQRDIQFGDRVFPLDTAITTNLDLTIYKLAYTYSFIQRDDSYLGLTAGAYVADWNIGLAGENLGQVSTRDITAPLPVAGLRGQYDFADRWSLAASGEFFLIEVDNIDGSLVDLYVGIDYQLTDHVALGLGYNDVDLDIDSTNAAYSGSIDWQYGGALLFLKFDF
jgi:hypothetical protein